MGIEADLRVAFYEQVFGFAAGRGHAGADVPVFFPNSDADRPRSADQNDPLLHIVTSVLPTSPEGLHTDGVEARHVWVASVDTFVRDGFGELLPLDIVDELRLAFPMFYVFYGQSHRFQVVRPVAAAPPVAYDGWFLVPSQVRIQAIA